MRILVIGGTRFFGIPMVNALLEHGHDVTLATRGNTPDSFGQRVQRIQIERTDEESIKTALQGEYFDVVIDKIAYCSNDIAYVMDHVDCGRYVYMSSTAVYESKTIDTVESDFDGRSGELVWCGRGTMPYAQMKRQAEYALWQHYPDRHWLAVRYPFVIGKDDYTNRLRFYVDHVMKSIPMNVDNLNNQMGFIRSDEAGYFLAFLAEQNVDGAINGCSNGTISAGEIIDYVEQKTGCRAILNDDGDDAPYNGEPAYGINTDKARKLGYRFTSLHDWIYDLLDWYIQSVANE